MTPMVDSGAAIKVCPNWYGFSPLVHETVVTQECWWRRVDSLPKIVSDYAEIKMKGDTTPMRVLFVVDSSTGILGATDVDRKVAVLVLLQNGWLSGWNSLVMH